MEREQTTIRLPAELKGRMQQEAEEISGNWGEVRGNWCERPTMNGDAVGKSGIVYFRDQAGTLSFLGTENNFAPPQSISKISI